MVRFIRDALIAPGPLSPADAGSHHLLFSALFREDLDT